MNMAASVALLCSMVASCGRRLFPPLSPALPPGKRFGIEHVRLRKRFFEPMLEGLDRIGGAIGHGVFAEFVLLTNTQPNRVDRDMALPGVVYSLGKRPAV